MLGFNATTERAGALRFEQSCSYCGALLRVTAEPNPAPPRTQYYRCPECGKNHDVMVGGAPGVRLLKPRTDGKRDRYQETMF